jgi:hypothetical protein
MAHAGAPPNYTYAQTPMTYRGATLNAANFDSRDTNGEIKRRSYSGATNLALMIVSLVLSVTALIVGSIGLSEAMTKADDNHIHTGNIAMKHASLDAAIAYARDIQEVGSNDFFEHESDNQYNIAPQSHAIVPVQSYTAYVKTTSPVNTSMWSNVMVKQADNWAQKEECYFHEPLLANSPNKCTRETYHACAGTVTFAEMCFGQFNNKKSNTNNYLNANTNAVSDYDTGVEFMEHMSTEFLQNVLDVYHASRMAANGGFDTAKAKAALNSKVLPCWKAAYDMAEGKYSKQNEKINTNEFLHVVQGNFEDEENTPSTYTGAKKWFQRAVAFATAFEEDQKFERNIKLKHLKNVPDFLYPGRAWTTTKPVDRNTNRVYDSFPLDPANNFHELYDAVFHADHAEYWAGQDQFPVEKNGVKCVDVRTKYANPRNEDRVVKSSDKSKVQCVGGAEPTGWTFATFGGSVSTSGYSFVKCSTVTPAAQTVLGSRDSYKEFVGKYTPTNGQQPVSSTISNTHTSVNVIVGTNDVAALLHLFTDKVGTVMDYTKLAYNFGLPIFKRNSYTLEFIQATKDTRATLVRYVDGVQTEFTAGETVTTVSSGWPGGGATLTLNANTLPAGDVWVRYTAFHRSNLGQLYAPNSMYTKLTVVDRDPTPTLEVSELTDLTSMVSGDYIFFGGTNPPTNNESITANNEVWSYVTKAEVPLLDELRKVRDQLPEVARRGEDRFGDTAMFSISNTTNVFEFSTAEGPKYQNHAVLDCASWAMSPNEEATHTYVNCVNIRAGFCTEASCTAAYADRVQKVQFRLMDRYGNYATTTKQFTVM